LQSIGSLNHFVKSFRRRAFEEDLPPAHRLELLDARRIAIVSEAEINPALAMLFT
jgi:hypothetical protein